ncbi:MAG: hypothetical protein GXP24_06685 [Planctomycetes bacterium]|nr:hypothetical protein [Planctomycetota bacterium]
MATRSSTSDSDVWRLDATKATLHAPQLAAGIDLLNPCGGLGQLLFGNEPIKGFALGVNPGTTAALSKHDLSDVYVRGSDLVATYAETNERPFSLQVYWRATIGVQGALLLDTILSLQTDLLESFPGLAVETELPAATAWLLPKEEAVATEVAIPCNLPGGQTDSLLLRPSQGNWSYAEMTHPEDRGESQIKRCEGDSLLVQVQRQLGGGFLEKGVIRCLRVRGVFLPRENDLELATKCLASLVTKEPPLTV